MALVAAARFIDALRHIQLLPPAQLDELVREAPRFPEARALAQHLLQRGWLTPFQVNQLLQERGPDLILGQYVLLERLGEGVRGQVFKARHRHMKRTVALKVIRKELLADADAVQRFYLEIEAASKLDHPNVVHAYDAGPVGPTHTLAMEFVKGTDLARLIQQAGPLSIPRACAYIAQTALGLQHAHERGLVHRDIKPSNLLVAHLPKVDPAGNGEPPDSDSSIEEAPSEDATGLYEWGQVKILDFGLARLRRFADDPANPLTHEGTMVGTPDFMAPEQAVDAHAVDIRADLYSLGCAFYFLLSGRPPFPGGSYIQKVDCHRWKEPEPIGKLRPELSPAVAALVQKLMAKRPEDRCKHPGEVAVELANLMGVRIGARPVPHTRTAIRPETKTGDSTTLPIRRSAPKPKRRPLVWVGLAALTAVLAGVLFLIVGRQSSTVNQAEQVPEPGTAAGDLYRSVARANANPANADETWQAFVDVRRRYPETPEAREAGDWLLKIPSPLDRLLAKNIPSAERYPNWQPKELVAVLGEQRWRHWHMPVHALAVRPDGQVVATGTELHGVFLWETATGRLLATLHGHQAPVRAVAFSPDGKYLASGGNDRTIRVWETGTRQLYHVFTGHAKAVLALAFSPDSQVLVSGCGAKGVRLWDLATRKQKAGLAEDRDNIQAIACAPDNRTIAIGGNKGAIHLWDTADLARPRATLPGHPNNVTGLIFLAEGNLLVSCGDDGWVRLWDTQTLQMKKAIHTPVRRIATSRDGQLLAAVGPRGAVRFWKLPTAEEHGKPVNTHLSPSALSFASDDKQVLAAGANSVLVRSGNPQTGELAAAPAGHLEPVTAVAFTPDCRTVLTGSGDRSVKLWDAATAKERTTISAEIGAVSAVACSPDGQTIAVASHFDPVVRFFDPAGKRKSVLKGHKGGVLSLAFAPDGRTLATISHDQTVRLWEVATGRQRFQRPVGKDAFSVTFSPDGKLLAFAGPNRSVRIYDLVADREQAVCTGHSSTVRALAFSPDGRTLASGSSDKTVRLWDAVTGRSRAVGSGHTDAVVSLVFTPDGSTVISSGWDGRVCFWKPQTGAKLREWVFPGPVGCLALAADGRHLATGNANGTAYIHRLALAPAAP